MTDSVVGRALRNGLVRQIAVPTRNHAAAEIFPHIADLKFFRYRAQTITHWPEASARLQGEVIGGRCIRNNESDLGKCGRFPGPTH